jgi:hypothetical protein
MNLLRSLTLVLAGVFCAAAHGQAPTVSPAGDLSAATCILNGGSNYAFEVSCTPASGSGTITATHQLFIVSLYAVDSPWYCSAGSPEYTQQTYPLLQLSAPSSSSFTVYAGTSVTLSATPYALNWTFVCHQ